MAYGDTFTGDTSEAEVMVSSPAIQAPTKRKAPELNLDNAYKTLSFYQENPQYLASPLTSHAANAHLAAASKIVGMNLQMERLNSASESARAENFISKKVATSLLKLAETSEDGAGIAAKWYALDENGQPLYKNPANASAIFEDYRLHTTAKADAGQVVGEEVTMPDGSTIQIVRNTTGKGYTVVPRKADTEAAIMEKESSRKISQLEADARDFEKKYVTANAEYVEKMSGKKVEGPDEKALKNKADYFRAQQNAKQQQADALRKPAAPSANAPSQTDIDYLKSNPSVKSLFEKRFGAGSADKYVP